MWRGTGRRSFRQCPRAGLVVPGAPEGQEHAEYPSSMAVVSLGYRTDLMLLGLQGSVIERQAGYQVIRTPANPTFHWGNFLLLGRGPDDLVAGLPLDHAALQPEQHQIRPVTQ